MGLLKFITRKKLDAGQTHQNLAQYRCFFVDCALSCQLIDRCGNIK